MAIDIENRVHAIFLEKWISVEKLMAILSELQDGDLLYPNQAGNLSVIRNDEQIGYIDISSENYESSSSER